MDTLTKIILITIVVLNSIALVSLIYKMFIDYRNKLLKEMYDNVEISLEVYNKYKKEL